MEFIEQLIRKGPGRKNLHGFISGLVPYSVEKYFTEVYTEENLEDPDSFDEAWHEWFYDYTAAIYDFVKVYHRKTKGAMLWSIYDEDQVTESIITRFFEPIIHAEGCNSPEHEDIKFSK